MKEDGSNLMVSIKGRSLTVFCESVISTTRMGECGFWLCRVCFWRDNEFRRKMGKVLWQLPKRSNIEIYTVLYGVFFKPIRRMSPRFSRL
jgi:hypothetical protein